METFSVVEKIQDLHYNTIIMIKLEILYDMFIKEVYGDKKNMKPFLHFILPEPIKRSMDWTQIAMESIDTASKRYHEGYLDLVTKAKMKNDQGEELEMDIYYLFEHKSTSETDILLQIQNYQHLAWAQDLSEGKKRRVILPIVFYYGQTEWTVPIQFSEHFGVATDIKPYLLDFQYLLFDATKWDYKNEEHQELKDNVSLLTAQALMKSMTNDDLIPSNEILRFQVERGIVKETKYNILFRNLLACPEDLIDDLTDEQLNLMQEKILPI